MEKRVPHSHTRKPAALLDFHDRLKPGGSGPPKAPTVIPRVHGPPKKSIVDNKKNISQYQERNGKVQWSLWKKREISPGKARKRKRKKSQLRKVEEPETAVADSRFDRTVSQSDSSNSSLGQPPGRFKKKKLSSKKEKPIPKSQPKKKRNVKTANRKTVAPKHDVPARKLKKRKTITSRTKKIKQPPRPFHF